MISCLKGFLVLFFLSTFLAAASTRFVSTWKNPLAGEIGKGDMKVAAFVVTQDESMRLGPEETLATELRNRGVDCIAGYTVLPGELARDQEKAKEFLQNAGITGAILMRVISNDKETTYVPGMAWYATSYYPTFWGYWNYGWSAVYTPGYLRTDQVVAIETLVYSIEDDKLLWAGRSETTNPKDIRKFVKNLVSEAGKKMRKDGLVKK